MYTENFKSMLQMWRYSLSIHEFIPVERNFSLMMSQGYPDQNTGLASAYFDLFRLENGKIVEQWDVVQTIPAEGDWVIQTENSNLIL